MALSATVKVYLGLVTNFYDQSPTWSEITSYVEELEIDRGRTDVNRPFDAGTVNLRLNNRGRVFDPMYSSSPYYAYFGKRMQLKVEGTYNGTTYPMFRGWVGGWPQDYPDDAQNSIVNLQAFDIMGLFALTDLGSTMLDYKYSQYTLWWQFGDGTSPNIIDASGNEKNGTIVYPYTGTLVDSVAIVPNSPKLSSVNSGNVKIASPARNVDVSVPVSIAAWVKTPSYSSFNGVIGIGGGATPINLYIGSGDNQLYYQYSLSPALPLGVTLALNTVYHFAFTYDSASLLSIYVNGDLLTTVNIGYLTTRLSAIVFFDVTGGMAFSHLVFDESHQWSDTEVDRIYRAGLTAFSETTSSRIDRLLDLIGFDNSTFENLSNKTTTNCYNYNFSGSLADAIQTAADTEYGYLFADRSGKLTLLDRYFESTETTSKNVQATFSDQGDIAYSDLSFEYSGDDIINQAVVTTGDNLQALVGNTNSINSYARRSQNVSTVLATQAEAFNLAKFLIGSKPNVTFAASDFTVKPERKPATYYPALLALEIGHRVQIVRKPMGVGSNITFTGILNAVKHRITPSDWDITLYAAPATQATGFFTLDTSALDGTDILGY